jgi:lipopolysaccharide/colanic/teichoic acid biosynthesis glycosyltransferase
MALAAWWLAGGLAVLGIASAALYLRGDLPMLEQTRTMVLGLFLAYGATTIATINIGRKAISETQPAMAVSVAVICFGFLAILLLLTRTYYSRSFLLAAFFVTIAWLILGRWFQQKYFLPKLAVEPGALDPAVLGCGKVRWLPLSSPEISDDAIDGLVVRGSCRDPEWQRLETQCALEGIPVYYGTLVEEHICGRISPERLSTGQLTEFKPRRLYAPVKRILDLLISLLAAPFLLALLVALAVVIKFDSPGPVFFVQPRVGQGERVFRMIKFRSMRKTDDAIEARFAAAGDDRVTKVGRFLRRTRLDELPQIWNVLKGDMSLVGPRPEQLGFVREFEKEIPFYGYRHLVKPGISGWAQINLGYAACVEETKEKLQFDLYYAKNSSLWLDLVILWRTLRIMVSGFGAR